MTGQNPPQDDSTAPTLDRAEREAFLRRQGWSPDLPTEQRQALEAKWPDEAIEEGLFHGF